MEDGFIYFASYARRVRKGHVRARVPDMAQMLFSIGRLVPNRRFAAE